ncbi:MAG: hypothetical protein H6810_04440 [Phycisphaeraceae bacterium]|nr:MAG: hypothetical protein H6810_04440 [Phycisphaeraceae bacterium]
MWKIDAVGGPLLAALAPIAIADEDRADLGRDRWRRAGFRLVMVPASLAESIEADLPHADAMRRVELGQPTRWMPLASSAVPPGTPLRTASGDRRAPDGRLELLVRAWAEPSLRDDRAFRVELAVGSLSPQPARPREVFAGLLRSVSIPEGLALVVLPAPPEEEWTEPAPIADSDAGEVGPEQAAPVAPGGLAPLPVPGANDSMPTQGPAPPEARSVGETLLITPPVLGPRPLPARREVLVLIPRWP